MRKLWLLCLIFPFLVAAEPAGSRVTINGPPRSLGDLATELSRQGNVRIDLDRIAGNPIALRLDNATFWDALEQIAAKSNQRLSIQPQGPRARLGGGPYRAVPISVRGPFRFAARRVLSRVDLDSGQSSTEVQINAVWEPSFKAFYAEIPGKSVTAIDEQGHPLSVTDDGGGKMEVKDFGQELVVHLSNVPRTAMQIASLKGKLNLVGTSQFPKFRFEHLPDPTKGIDPETPKERLEQAGVAATLTKFKRAGRILIVAVELEYPKGGPEFESFQSFLRDNEIWLERNGTKFPTTDFEIGTEHQGKTIVTYRFSENEKSGLVVSNPNEWKLVLRTPGPIVEVTVDFELKNIPLR